MKMACRQVRTRPYLQNLFGQEYIAYFLASYNDETLQHSLSSRKVFQKTVARPGDASTTKIFPAFDAQVDQTGLRLHHARTSENECVCTQCGAGVLCEGKRLCHKTARAPFRSKTHVSCKKLPVHTRSSQPSSRHHLRSGLIY